MEKKKLQSYDDIMDFLDNLNCERRIINSQLAVMGVSLFDAEAREKKNYLKKRLKEMKHIFKYFDRLFVEYTTFDREILLPFLAEYLSKNTDTKYVVTKGEDMVFCGKYYSYDYYYFIYPVKDILSFKCKGYNIDDCLDYDSLKNKASRNFLCLESYSSYNLMNLDGLVKPFSEFIELRDIAIKLINLKLLYPGMSNEERLICALSPVMSNRKFRKEKGYSKEYINGKKLGDMSISEVYSVKKR